MSLPLLGLALQGLTAAASARQQRRLAVVAVAGAVGLCALLAGLVLLGWAMFLGFGTMLSLPWAAAAAAVSLIALAGLAGLLAYGLRPSPAGDMAALLAQAEPLIRQNPGTAMLGAAMLGGLTALLARR
jgi:hypothetical protein